MFSHFNKSKVSSKTYFKFKNQKADVLYIYTRNKKQDIKNE